MKLLTCNRVMPFGAPVDGALLEPPMQQTRKSSLPFARSRKGCLFHLQRLLLLLALAVPGFAQPTTPQSIRVVMDNDYPPFAFTDNGGKLQGILVDEWQLWEKETGIKVEIHGMDWGKALQRMKAGEFDVIDTIFDTKERTRYWDFSRKYARIEVPIFFREDMSGITGVESLKSFPVAVKEGDSAADLLEQQGVKDLRRFPSYQAIIEAAKEHKVNVFVVDKPPALYLLNKLGIEKEFRQSNPVNVGHFHRAVQKGNITLLKEIERGFASLKATKSGELKRIQQKWYGKAVEGYANLRYLGYLLVSGLLLISGLVTWNLSLKRLVNRRTAALQQSESRLRAILDHIPDWVWLKDPNSTYITANAPYAQAVNRSLETLPGRSDIELWPEADARQFVADDEAVVESGQTSHITRKVTDAHGTIRWVETLKAPIRSPEGKTIGTVGIARDITKRKEAEESLKRSQASLEAAQALARMGNWEQDPANQTGFWSREMFHLFNRDPALGAPMFPEFVAELVHPEDQASLMEVHRKVIETKLPASQVYRTNPAHGPVRHFESRISARLDAQGHLVHLDGTVLDITERLQAETQLRHINRTLQMISDCDQVLVRATDEAELLHAICRLVIDVGGYRMAWVGLAEQDEARSVRPVAEAGFVEGYLDTADITWADSERGRGPVGTAIRTKQTVVSRNILTDPAFEPWCKAAIQRGYAASAALPLQRGQRVLGALTVYASEPDAFDPAEVGLLTQLADDLAYGIAALRTRLEQKRIEDELHLLSARLLQVRDLERRRLARELHDTTAQHLAALSLGLTNLKGLLVNSSERAAVLCSDCIELAHKAAQEIRTHSYLLHPPLLEVMGLAGAIEEYAQGFSARSGIAVEVNMPEDFGRLPEDMELALFRIVQESLTNVLKHSRSARAVIRFTRQRSSVKLVVQDMGSGITADLLARIKSMGGGSGVGLGGMQERMRLLGGELELDSGPEGTTVCATVPLDESPSKSKSII